MNIIWDEKKNKKLIDERGISFEEIAELIIEKRYITILENPVRKNQQIFLLFLNKYVHVVPFIVDKDNNLILKTVFPSRKFHKIYGEKNNENNS